MLGTGEIPLTWRHHVQDGLPIMTVAGTMTAASGERLYAAMVAVVRQRRGAVLIDVSALVVADESAIAVFARIRTLALQWPDVLVAVCAPSAEVTRLLGPHVVDPRLLFTTVAAGLAAALVRVPPVTEELLPVAASARSARNVVTDACLRWNEPGLIGSAALVASELATNAAQHAHTMMTIEVRLRPCHLHIAVFDGSSAPAVPRCAGPPGDGGLGLRLVDTVSAAWGSTPLPAGKVVWSALDRHDLP